MSNQLGLALDLLSDRHIAEAARAKRAYYTFRRGVAVAAAAAAVLILVFGLPIFDADGYIMTAPGIISVSAQTKDGGDVIEVEMREGISYKYVSPLHNFPGYRFRLQAPDTCSGVIGFYVTTPLGYVAAPEDFKYTYSAITVGNGGIFSYNPFRLGHKIHEDMETLKQINPSALYVRIVMLENTHIIGFSIIRIAGPDNVRLLCNISFPHTEEHYQDISADYVNKRMDAIIQADSK
jgi:hypothetical protein